MKILFVTSEFVSDARCDGGLANYLNRLAIALAELGHQPIVICPGEEDRSCKRDHVRIDTVAVTETARDAWTNRLTLGRFATMLALTRLGRRLADHVDRIIDEEEVDIIQYGHLGGLGAFRPRRVPAVVRISSSTTQYRRAGGYDNLSAFAMWQQVALERRSMRRADGVFGPGAATAAVVARELGRTVEVIEPPFFVETTITDDSVLQARLGDARYLLFAGRLNAQKGLLTIAEIVGALLERHPDLVFACAGREHAGHRGRTMAEHLLASAGPHRDRMLLLGELQHPLLYPIMEHATAVVLPSLAENLPNVALEAMAHGRVVIGTRGTGFEQLIVDNASGMLCEPGDPGSLLDAIERALALTVPEREAMGRRARLELDRLRPERAVSNHLRYYDRVIADFHGRRATEPTRTGERA